MLGDLHSFVGMQRGADLAPVQIVKVDDDLGVALLCFDLLDALAGLQRGQRIGVHHKATGQLHLHDSHIGALRIARHRHKAGAGRQMQVVRMGIAIHCGIQHESRPGAGHICVVFVANLSQRQATPSGRDADVLDVVGQL